VKLTLASITPHARPARYDPVVADYVTRIQPYAPVETSSYRSADALFESLGRSTGRSAGRTPPVIILLDGRGRRLSSEDLARYLRRLQDEGRQRIVFAVGPADGWTDADRVRAGLLLSLGPMTLPHELARLVLSEQLYRAFTILAGHPYHRAG
jgi:23S rRNA (pseudouridine1915-N3)-methyltransferase